MVASLSQRKAGGLHEVGDDLLGEAQRCVDASTDGGSALGHLRGAGECGIYAFNAVADCGRIARKFLAERHGRSEEHTSELQSRGHLVCRLLLEKIKDQIIERV